MRILFISNDPLLQGNYLNLLAGIAEPDSIFFVYTSEAAIKFITHRTIALQQPLDLVIIKSVEYSEVIQNFQRFIISDSSITYSNRDFNLRSLPIFLLLEKRFDRRSRYSLGLAAIDDSDTGINFESYRPKIVDIIKDWRRSVVAELDALGIKSNSGRINYSNLKLIFEKRMIDTNILSENFRYFPRKLEYYWLKDNKHQIEQGINTFIKMLKWSAQNKKHAEKSYHTFFNENLQFLERDVYKKTWHEAKFKRQNNQFYSPDFSLETNLNYLTDLSILEVKLPNERLVGKRDFHKNILGKVFNHLKQVSNYKDYLGDQMNKSIVEKELGFMPSKIEFNILIGRMEEKQEHEELINTTMRQFGKQDIRLLSYDELMEYQVAFLERMNLLNIF